jgi:hypothetical protein
LLFRARKRLQAELKPARVASGALALPLALRESLAWAIPGFASGSSGGGLAKLASLPLLAKVAGAAATLTAAGTIGYVQLQAREHDAAVVRPATPVIEHGSGHRVAKPVQLERVSFVQPAPTPAAAPRNAEEEPGNDDDFAEGQSAGSEGGGEPAESEDAGDDQGVVDAQGDDGDSTSAREEADGDQAGDPGAGDSDDSDSSNSGSDG